MVENIAGICLGAVIGWLVVYFVTRFPSYTPKVLGSLISVILGGTVVGFLAKLGSVRETLSYYLIGLAVGVVVGIILYTIKHHSPPAF
jgi:hypothetical protein